MSEDILKRAAALKELVWIGPQDAVREVLDALCAEVEVLRRRPSYMELHRVQEQYRSIMEDCAKSKCVIYQENADLRFEGYHAVESVKVELTALRKVLDMARDTAKSIKFGGDWLAELYANQDSGAINMPLAYSKDAYRLSKELLSLLEGATK